MIVSCYHFPCQLWYFNWRAHWESSSGDEVNWIWLCNLMNNPVQLRLAFISQLLLAHFHEVLPLWSIVAQLFQSVVVFFFHISSPHASKIAIPLSLWMLSVWSLMWDCLSYLGLIHKTKLRNLVAVGSNCSQQSMPAPLVLVYDLIKCKKIFNDFQPWTLSYFAFLEANSWGKEGRQSIVTS